MRMTMRTGSPTAARLLSRGQVVFATVAAAAAAAEGVLLGPVALLRTAVALAIAFYVVFVGLKVILWWAAARQPGSRPAAGAAPGRDHPALPGYTVLVPLRGEANVITRLVAALSAMRYPPEKLQVLLLLEEYDAETQAGGGG